MCSCSTNPATIWTSNRSKRSPKRLIGYSGTVIFTSHDRHFMHRVATHVMEVRAGRVASYPGSFDEYVYRIQKRNRHRTACPAQRRPPSRSSPPADCSDRKVSRANSTATRRRS